MSFRTPDVGGCSPLLPFHGTSNSTSSYVAVWTGLCMPWCSTDPLLSSPSLCIFANMHPAPGSSAADPNSMDTGRATGEYGGPRNWHLYWKMKADIIGWESSEKALHAGCCIATSGWSPATKEFSSCGFGWVLLWTQNSERSLHNSY